MSAYMSDIIFWCIMGIEDGPYHSIEENAEIVREALVAEFGEDNIPSVGKIAEEFRRRL